MNNHIVENASAPADFAGFLAASPRPIFPAALVEKLQAAQKFCDDLHIEGRKFTEQAANFELGQIERTATENPTAANLRKMADTDPATLRANYKRVSETIGNSLRTHLESTVRPLLLEARTLVNAAVDAEIAHVTAAQSALYRNYKVEYTPATDPLVLALDSFKNRFNTPLMREGMTPEPDMVRSFVGPLAPLTGTPAPVAPVATPTKSTKLRTATEAALAAA